VRLEPTGRGGLQSRLRDADTDLQRVLAFGLDFPFGLPDRRSPRRSWRPVPGGRMVGAFARRLGGCPAPST
jgi:hypothetical protein